jgi:DNA invertase Pin-like site-specific DNA recombinase
MRIGIYARVSTKDQSCELQVRDLRTYCTARGFDLVREYVDVGQSGAKDSRPELNILMDDARKRQFDAIVVWRFDRFARSTKHLLSALEEFRSLGIQFISYQENVDTSTPLGQALFTIVSAVAQLERDLIRGCSHPNPSNQGRFPPVRTEVNATNVASAKSKPWEERRRGVSGHINV